LTKTNENFSQQFSVCVFWHVTLTDWCGVATVGSVLLQDEAKGDSQTPVVINMDGADQRLAERQQQLQLIDEQVVVIIITTYNYYKLI